MDLIIKEQTVNNYNVLILKLEKPVFGGFYKTALYLAGSKVNEKDGLNLDAANEVFKNTINAILNFELSKNISQ